MTRFRETRPPGPRGWRLLHALLQVRRDRLGLVHRMRHEFGDLVTLAMGSRRLLLVMHPSHVNHVLRLHSENYTKGLGLSDARPLLGNGLLTSSGEAWGDHRRLLQPVFRREQIAAHATVMIRRAQALGDRWAAAVGEGTPVDVPAAMTRLTLDILGQTIIGADLASHADQIRVDLEVIARWVARRMSGVVRTPIALPTPANVAMRGALRRLESLACTCMRERGAPVAGASDALAVLLGEAVRGRQDAGTIARDEFMTLLLAGHETTGAVLSWVWMLLAHHSGVQRRLHDEIDRVVGDHPSAEAIGRLRYTRMVLDEALRLYPPVWMIPRRATAFDQIGGVDVQPGTEVLLCIHEMQRHPACWESPDAFDPERFAPERMDRQALTAFLPFGEGARACMGRHFAMLEATLVIATLARRFSVEPVTSRDPFPGGNPSLTLRPCGGLLRIHFRGCVAGAQYERARPDGRAELSPATR